MHSFHTPVCRALAALALCHFALPLHAADAPVIGAVVIAKQAKETGSFLTWLDQPTKAQLPENQLVKITMRNDTDRHGTTGATSHFAADDAVYIYGSSPEKNGVGILRVGADLKTQWFPMGENKGVHSRGTLMLRDVEFQQTSNGSSPVFYFFPSRTGEADTSIYVGRVDASGKIVLQEDNFLTLKSVHGYPFPYLHTRAHSDGVSVPTSAGRAFVEEFTWRDSEKITLFAGKDSAPLNLYVLDKNDKILGVRELVLPPLRSTYFLPSADGTVVKTKRERDSQWKGEFLLPEKKLLSVECSNHSSPFGKKLFVARSHSEESDTFYIW
ncbi:MAG: hypothetical protein LBV28_02475 [Puniceicoccales bacterium]|jgi:hypothetical protein|nr:hypothetical protein [Puniceicoccales bacterium]